MSSLPLMPMSLCSHGRFLLKPMRPMSHYLTSPVARYLVPLRPIFLTFRTASVIVSQHKFQETNFAGANAILAADIADKKTEKILSRQHAMKERRHGEYARHDREQLKQANSAITNLTRNGCYKEALELFRRVPEPDSTLYNVTLNACAKGFLYEEACELWETMSPEQKCVVSYTTMLEVCKKRKKVHEAERLFSEMRSLGVEPNAITYNIMVGVYGMLATPLYTEKAIEVFERAYASFFPTANVTTKQMLFVAVMTATSRIGDYGKTREFFVRLVNDGIAPNNLHFNALLTSCAKNSDVETAEAVFTLMPSYHIVPRVEDYSILIACCRNDLSRCLKVFGDMERAGVAPSERIYQQLLHAHVIAEDGPGARALLDRAVGLNLQSSVVQDLIRRANSLTGDPA